MFLSVQRTVLHRAVHHVQSIVERRNVMPMLSNIKIVAKDNSVTLSTTDLDIHVSESIAANVKEEGNITVPALTLYKIVKKLKDEEIEILKHRTEDSKITIKTSGSEFDLPSLPAEEFPDFENIDDTTSFNLKSSILRDLFYKTEHAISHEEARYYLNGVYLHVVKNQNDDEKYLRAVATDGHRLARVQTNMVDGNLDFEGIIVPKKAVTEISKILEDYVGDVKVSVSNKSIILSAGNILITSKVIDGKFPDYEKVIPNVNDRELDVNKNDLLQSIDLVISVSNDKTQAVKMSLNESKSKVIISATSELNGNARGMQEVTASYSHDNNIMLGFNSRYIIDSLCVIEDEKAQFVLSENYGAVILKAPANDNDLYILMPIEI